MFNSLSGIKQLLETKFILYSLLLRKKIFVKYEMRYEKRIIFELE